MYVCCSAPWLFIEYMDEHISVLNESLFETKENKNDNAFNLDVSMYF